MMEFTPEFVEKAKKASTSEELIAIAKENGIELDAKQAGILFGIVNEPFHGEPSHGEPSHGELSDDDLGAAVGGNGSESDPDFDPGLLRVRRKCTICGGRIGLINYYNSDGVVVCLDCGRRSAVKDLLELKQGPGFNPGF